MPPKPLTFFPSAAPSASIYFDGLLCLCFDDEKECIVGVNNQPSHKLKFAIWRKGNCQKIADITIPQDPQLKETYEIRVNDPIPPSSGVGSGVYVYSPTGSPIPGRHAYNFWLDAEGANAHNTVVPKYSHKLYPRFQIKHAVFSTYAVSLSDFRFEKKGTVVSTIGNLALAIVAHAFHTPAGSIEILRNGTLILTLPALTGDEYEIAITNSCKPGKCSYSPTAMDPKDRNDFYLYYDVINIGSANQLELVNYSPAGSTDPVPLGKCNSWDQTTPTDLSDRTPCMAILLGKSSTL